MKAILFIAILFFSIPALCQQSKEDSLFAVLSANDTDDISFTISNKSGSSIKLKRDTVLINIIPATMHLKIGTRLYLYSNGKISEVKPVKKKN